MFISRHWFLFLLIFLFLLSMLAWSARTQLAEFVVTSAMSDAGMTGITVDINELEINQSSISRLNLTISTDTALLFLEARSINIRYQPEKIINGQIDKLSIDALKVNYKKTSRKADTLSATRNPFEPVKYIKTLKQALAKYMFFNELVIENLMLNSSPQSNFNGKSLRFIALRQDKSVTAEITLLNRQPAEESTNSSQLVINHLTQDQLKAELRLFNPASTNAGKLAANLDLAIQNVKASGRYMIRPQALLSWLQPWLSGGSDLLDQKSINETAEVNGSISLDFAPDQQIIATLSAVSDNLSYREYGADNAIIKMKFKIPTDNPGQRVQILNGSYIKAGDYNYGNYSLQASTIFLVGELANTSGNWLYRGGLRLDSFATAYQSQRLQLKNINARLMANSEKLEISGDFLPIAVTGKFTFSLSQALTGQYAGELRIKSIEPLDLNADDSRLSQLVTHWPYPFDLMTGEIKLTSHAAWSRQNEFRLRSNIQFTEVGGYYNEIVFSGLSFEHELELLPLLHSIHTGSVNLRLIDSGVTASNISSSFKLDAADTGPLPRLEIEDLQGEIFGGVFSAVDFVYDANQSSNHLRIDATEIDLAEIVKTQQLKDLTMTGRVSGFIPVEINENGVRIEDGAFINDIDNGRIRYNPETTSEQLKQNTLTGIALDALRDFRYSYLSAGVNYSEDGNLKINLRLKGTSPELDTKRPVHLNINTEQNLLSLLKSLRYAQGISEKIDNKVRHIYENKQK